MTKNEDNFWHKYKKNFVRNSTSDKSSFNQKNEKIDNDKRH